MRNTGKTKRTWSSWGCPTPAWEARAAWRKSPPLWRKTATPTPPLWTREARSPFYTYYVTAFPTTFMIDKEGNVYGYASGQLTKDMMKDIIPPDRGGQV